MTITQLTTFLKIADCGNFSSAASSLGYAGSTVTMQVKQLEDELGVELFDRLGKTVHLTAAGERLLIYAEKMQQLEREILNDVPESEEPSGVLKLGVSESLCYNHFPHLLMEYKKMYPKVDIQITFINHDSFPDMLKKGLLDIVYTLNPIIERDDLRLIYSDKENLGFYVSPNHPLARKKRVTEMDIENVPLLLTANNCSFRKMLMTHLDDLGINTRIALETSSKEILKQFAINEMGIAFIPDMSADSEVENGKLIKLNWKGAEFPIYSQLFVHKDKKINNSLRGLIDIISEN